MRLATVLRTSCNASRQSRVRERERERDLAGCAKRGEKCSVLFPDARVFLASEDRHVTRLVSLSRVVPDRPQAGTADE